MRISLLCVGLLAAAFSTARANDPAPFSLRKNDVVVFAGGTDMLRLQRTGSLETILTSQFADARPKFRDLSWEADTVFRQGTIVERWRKDGWRGLDAFGDLDVQLKRVGTTVVIAQFGRLESMAGPEGLPRFGEAYEKLIERFQKHTRKVVLITPTPFESVPGREHLLPDVAKRNADLALYVQEISRIAAERKLPFVDLFSNAKPGLTDNGLHVKVERQGDVAREIARQLGLTIPDAATMRKLRPAVVEKHRLWYDYWRPANWKLLYGDDAQRQFTRGDVPFREEWRKLLPMIATAEERIFLITRGGEDPGPLRPAPEKLHGSSDADIEKELASFTVADGFQVNLFASEKHGLTSPLNLRWDPAGRMYVTVTTTYPHVFPGDVPNDKVIVLEDSDRDGVADKSTVFAEGLNIPTGIELGDGGVYIGQNTEILFLRDTNGDGKADSRQVLLGGFGNGDSHQTINSFIWSPGGELFFGHGDGCESRVETPWGSADLFNAGFYRFRPRRIQLVPFLEGHMAAGNPWGVAFDAWGQAISVDGAGGVNWLTPGLIDTTHVRRLKRIGNPGGYCGVGYLDGRHLPESMQGHFVTGDFKSNRVKRFALKENGSGFVVDWKEPLLHSKHRNFRPVDVKIGPDGAIYIVDWYNPVTCHQDDAYRHPERDKAHGRIWRVSSKTAQPIRPPNLNEASVEQLVEQLKSPEHWTRYQAKRALTTRDTKATAKALDKWVRGLDPKDAQYEHYLFSALGAYATIEVVEPRLLNRLLNAADPRARAYACRIVARWHDRLDDPLELLAARVADSNPRVRLEAVVACSAIPDARAIEVAARVVDLPMDEWLEYAFKQTVHALRPYWLPAFRDGKVTFSRPNQLAAVLNESGGGEVIGSLKELVETGMLSGSAKASAIAAIVSVGSPEDIDRFGLDKKRFTSEGGKYDAASHSETLAQLVELAEFRNVRLAGDPAARINELVVENHPKLKASAMTLAGLWKLEKTHDHVVLAAKDESLSVPVRSAAFAAMAKMNLPTGKEMLAGFASPPGPAVIRSAAVRALFEVDVDDAAMLAAELISTSDLKSLDAGAILAAGLRRSGGANALASALKSTKLSPEQAKLLLRSFYSTGWTEKSLVDELLKASGAVAQTPEFSKERVQSLVEESKSKGDASRGAKYFRGMACVSCHRVTGVGGEVGPDLTAIGTTLSGERIVEELLWPNRQIKEGFAQLIVVTNDGKVVTGYERKTRETEKSGDIILEDPVSKKRITIRKADIDETHPGRSAMPAGLTALLSRDQLLDLIRYLTQLGRIE